MATSPNVRGPKRVSFADDIETLNKDSDGETPANPTTCIVVLALVNFCYALGLSLQGPLFPKLAEEKGLRPSIYTLAFGAHYLSYFIFIPLVGRVTQQVKNKYILFTGALVVGLCAILLGSLQWCPVGAKFWASAIAIRAMEGFGAASIRVASYTTAASLFPAKIWKFSLWIEVFFSLGLAIGPIAGTVTHDVYSFSLPFYCSGLLTVIAAVCVIIVLPEPSNGGILDLSWNFLSLFKQPANLIYISNVFATSFYSGFLEAVLEPYLKQFQLSAVMLGVFFSIPVITHCITALSWKWLNEKGFNGILLIFVCSILIVGSTVLIAPAPVFHMKISLSVVIVALVLKGLGEGGQFVVSFTSSFKDAITRGFSNNVSTHCMMLEMFAWTMTCGMFVGSSVSGIVYETIAFENGTLILLGLEILPLPFLFVYAFQRNYKKFVHLATTEETTRILPNSENSEEQAEH